MDTMTKQQEVAKVMEALKEVGKPGDIIYTVLRSTSKSGMCWRMDFYVLKDNEPLFLTGKVAKVLGLRYALADWQKSAGLGVFGCGMDMGFYVVYELGRRLFPDGGNYVSGCNGSKDTKTDGGYCLKHHWL